MRATARTVLVAFADMACVAAAVQLALWLRYDMDVPAHAEAEALGMTLFAAGAHLVAGTVTGLYRHHYRPASFDEALGLAKTIAISSAAVIVVNELANRALPLSVALVVGPLAIFMTSVVRWVWRADQERRIRDAASGASPVVVVGAGEAGSQIVGQLLRSAHSPFRPVAVVDDDPRKRRLRVFGIPVTGTSDDLARVALASGAEQVLIAVPSASPGQLRELSDRARAADLDVLVLPSVVDMFGLSVSVGDIRPLTEEDLLGRGQADIDIDAISGYISGHRVLVTGAGGSIGSELCRQVNRFAPASLVMLDRDESALHGVELSITGRATLDSRNLVVCDIRDVERLDEVFEEHRPDVVFHAAALKHLPLLEMHPGEAVKSNCIGTLNVLRAATRYGVARFVNISTDKAADPISTLGRSKRIAERITAHWSADHPGTFLSVRFGNVLGSRGSVLTTFRSQVDSGGPITVTHPDVTRFFMTIEEAVRLVIQAGALDLDGHALILDMGEPIRIDDVARRLAAASDRPIEVVYTGLRPGEKLHEVLTAPHEQGQRTKHPLITEVPVPPLDPSLLEPLVLRGTPGSVHDQLAELLDGDALRAAEQGAPQVRSGPE